MALMKLELKPLSVHGVPFVVAAMAFLSDNWKCIPVKPGRKDFGAMKRMAECIATGRVPDILAPFALSRFDSFALVNEMGATAASH